MNKTVFKWFSLVVLFVLLVSCGSADFKNLDSATNTTKGNDETGGDPTMFGVAFPTDLAISSPFAAVTGQSVSAGKSVLASSNVKLVKAYTERREEIDNMLRGEGPEDCKFNVDIFKLPPQVNCYGPKIRFYNHPDGGVSGVLPIGDTGIWTENNFDASGDTGEACAAAKINSLVADVAAKVDTAIDMFSGMFCMARVEKRDSLPERGEEVDLRDGLEAVAQGVGVSVSEARVERHDEDMDGGRPVYRSRIAAAVLKMGKSAVLDINLEHVPLDDNNNAYKGKLWYTIKDESGISGGIRQIAYSITYSKNDDGMLKYSVTSANYYSTKINPFDEKYDIAANGQWSGNFNLGTYEIDTENGRGTFSFAWQAGPFDGNTRTVVADSECAYFGYGPAVQGGRAGSIDGFICNWAGPGSEPFGMKRVLPLVQRQCMTLDRESGKFVSDSEFLNIKYAPTNSCDVDENSGWEFMFYADANEPIPDEITSNDKNEAGVYPNTLLDIREMEMKIVPPAPVGDVR